MSDQIISILAFLVLISIPFIVKWAELKNKTTTFQSKPTKQKLDIKNIKKNPVQKLPNQDSVIFFRNKHDGSVMYIGRISDEIKIIPAIVKVNPAAMHRIIRKDLKVAHAMVKAAIISLSKGDVQLATHLFNIALDNKECLSSGDKIKVTKFYEVYFNRKCENEELEGFYKKFANLSIAIEVDSSDADLYYQRGNAYAQNDEHNKAIADFTKVIELLPNSDCAYYNRGNSYGSISENHNFAIQDYTKAIELNPRFAEAYNNRGVMYYRKDEIDTALPDFQKALLLDPHYAHPMANLGNFYERKNDKYSAEYWLWRAFIYSNKNDKEFVDYIWRRLKSLNYFFNYK